MNVEITIITTNKSIVFRANGSSTYVLMLPALCCVATILWITGVRRTIIIEVPILAISDDIIKPVCDIARLNQHPPNVVCCVAINQFVTPIVLLWIVLPIRLNEFNPNQLPLTWRLYLCHPLQGLFINLDAKGVARSPKVLVKTLFGCSWIFRSNRLGSPGSKSGAKLPRRRAVQCLLVARKGLFDSVRDAGSVPVLPDSAPRRHRSGRPSAAARARCRRVRALRRWNLRRRNQQRYPSDVSRRRVSRARRHCRDGLRCPS